MEYFMELKTIRNIDAENFNLIPLDRNGVWEKSLVVYYQKFFACSNLMQFLHTSG